jgi:hypothetical protein
MLDASTFDAHHRRNKGMGGTSRPDRDSLPNLLALDPLVHNGGPRSVHARRQAAQERGLLVPKHVDEVITWPVELWSGRWVLLTEDGRYLDVPAA